MMVYKGCRIVDPLLFKVSTSLGVDCSASHAGRFNLWTISLRYPLSEPQSRTGHFGEISLSSAEESNRDSLDVLSVVLSLCLLSDSGTNLVNVSDDPCYCSV
jgi:hypothetical protein